MNWEPEVVKTVNLDYDSLLVIETKHGDTVCVIHQGVVLIARGPARSTGQPHGSNWRFLRLPARGWWARLWTLSGRMQWTKPNPAQWVPT